MPIKTKEVKYLIKTKGGFITIPPTPKDGKTVAIRLTKNKKDTTQFDKEEAKRLSSYLLSERVRLESALIKDLDIQRHIFLERWDKKGVEDFLDDFMKFAASEEEE